MRPTGPQLRVALPRSYTVPLPAALFLLLLLALVFHHQLKQIAGEADDLEASLIECQNGRRATDSSLESLRRRHNSLQSQAEAYRNALSPEQQAAVEATFQGGGVYGGGARGPPFEWPENDAHRIAGGTTAGGMQIRKIADANVGPALPEESLKAAAEAANAARKRGDAPIAAVVVMACSRPTHLRKALTSLVQIHARDIRFPRITVSQDGNHAATAAVAREFVAAHGGLLRHWQHAQVEKPKLLKKGDNPAYYRIAAHYKWALDKLFAEEGNLRVIILEDDMVLAPDFFEYFAAMAPVLDADPARLWCASSWSDHGQAKFVGDPSAVYRSDFFPGLGWMLTSATWDTLTSSWPTAFWDDWMRMNATRKGRQCVRPEMCRTYNIGRLGASRGQFYDQYLAPVAMNTQFVPWTAHNLSFLADAEQYESFMAALVGAASPIDSATAALRVASAVTEDDPPGADLVYAYSNGPQYTAFAAGLGLMKDLKEGQPRGSYKGVVTVRLHGTTRLFIAPAAYVDQVRRELRTQVQKEHPPGEAESTDHAPVVVGGEPGAGQL